jgi:heparan-alpha-glucosaminide N-acetyltransferase
MQPQRLLSLDAYRGAVMLFMASASFGIPQVAATDPQHPLAWLAPLLEHVPWIGCAPWDLIQPAFMFMVGVAMPYSYGKRAALGESTRTQLFHAISRSIILILLAVMLASRKHQTWVFTNVLGQIGLGYSFLYLVSKLSLRNQVITAASLLFGYWLLFALYPIQPAPDPDDGALTGFYAHWSKNANIAYHFDLWFLNLFPTEKPWASNPGGYHTLNFIPSLATMILGLLAGQYLKKDLPLLTKIRKLLIAGVLLILVGWVLGQFACPIVKRIWTPTWALFSGGWVVLLLAFFLWWVDHLQLHRLAMPLAIVGMNSIAIYLGSQLCTGWLKEFLHIHFGGTQFYTTGSGPIYERCGVLLLLWALCWWLHKNKAYLRI